MKITNKQIMNIIQNNDATNRDMYIAVRSVMDHAQDNITTRVRKTIHYWNKSNYAMLCIEIRKLIN